MEQVYLDPTVIEEGRQAFRDGLVSSLNPYKGNDWDPPDNDLRKKENSWDEGWEQESQKVNGF